MVLRGPSLLQALDRVVLFDFQDLVERAAHRVPELVELLQGDFEELRPSVARVHLHQDVGLEHSPRLVRGKRHVDPPPAEATKATIQEGKRGQSA